jgi:hypothetical protein
MKARNRHRIINLHRAFAFSSGSFELKDAELVMMGGS